MAITGQIPIGRMPIDYLNQGTGAINDILQKARAAALQRQQLEEMAKFHGADIGLRQQAGARAAQQMDPMFKVRQLQAMIQGLRGLSGGIPQEQSNMPMGQDMSSEGAQSMPNMPPLSADNSGNPGVTTDGPGPIMSGSPFVGRAGYKPQQQPQPQEPQNPLSEEIMPGITLEDITRHALGLPARKAPIESPQEKQMRELQTNQAKLQQKESATQQHEVHKELKAVEKDLPVLQESIKGVQDLLKIAKENPDMFGHGFMPDRYAKTTKNKNFGIWQNLIADRIAGLESKLSSRGNIVALKMASQLKPGHADQQQVAIGKLESMLGQLQRQLQNSMKKTGKLGGEVPKFADEDMVVVEGPNGDETMTYAQAKALGAV